MTLAIALILLIAWFLGVIGIFSIGAGVHVLLGIAIVVILVHLFRSKDQS